MSSTEGLPPVQSSAVPAATVNDDVSRLTLLIVVPCVLATILVALIVQRCRALHRRQTRELERLRLGVNGPPPEGEVEKPILHTVILDTVVDENKPWKAIKPLSATITSPKPPEPKANAIRPLQDTALLALPLREVINAAKTVMRPVPKAVVFKEDDVDKTFFTGLIIKMPSSLAPIHRKEETEDSKWEDEQLPDLVIGYQEMPWLSLNRTTGIGAMETKI